MQDYEGDSWLEIAVKVAREVLKTRIIASDSDQQAIVFYGTREMKNDNGFEGVYVFQNLDNPEAKRIRDLQDLLGTPSPLKLPYQLSPERCGHSKLVVTSNVFNALSCELFRQRPNFKALKPISADSNRLVHFILFSTMHAASGKCF